MTAPTHHNSRKTPKQLPVENCIERESCITEKPKYPRKSRAKQCIRWNEYVLREHKECLERLKAIAKRFPDLTPQQVRIATLVAEMLPSYEIARIFGVTEKAVDKVRSRIRKKVGVEDGAPLAAFLLAKAV